MWHFIEYVCCHLIANIGHLDPNIEIEASQPRFQSRPVALELLVEYHAFSPINDRLSLVNVQHCWS